MFSVRFVDIDVFANDNVDDLIAIFLFLSGLANASNISTLNVDDDDIIFENFTINSSNMINNNGSLDLSSSNNDDDVVDQNQSISSNSIMMMMNQSIINDNEKSIKQLDDDELISINDDNRLKINKIIREKQAKNDDDGDSRLSSKSKSRVPKSSSSANVIVDTIDTIDNQLIDNRFKSVSFSLSSPPPLPLSSSSKKKLNTKHPNNNKKKNPPLKNLSFSKSFEQTKSDYLNHQQPTTTKSSIINRLPMNNTFTTFQSTPVITKNHLNSSLKSHSFDNQNSNSNQTFEHMNQSKLKLNNSCCLSSATFVSSSVS